MANTKNWWHARGAVSLGKLRIKIDEEEEAMPYQEPYMCRRLSWAAKLCGLGALLGLLLFPAGNGASGQMLGSQIHDNGGGTKGEAGADRAVRLLKVIPVP